MSIPERRFLELAHVQRSPHRIGEMIADLLSLEDPDPGDEPAGEICAVVVQTRFPGRSLVCWLVVFVGYDVAERDEKRYSVLVQFAERVIAVRNLIGIVSPSNGLIDFFYLHYRILL